MRSILKLFLSFIPAPRFVFPSWIQGSRDMMVFYKYQMRKTSPLAVLLKKSVPTNMVIHEAVIVYMLCHQISTITCLNMMVTGTGNVTITHVHNYSSQDRFRRDAHAVEILETHFGRRDRSESDFGKRSTVTSYSVGYESTIIINIADNSTYSTSTVMHICEYIMVALTIFGLAANILTLVTLSINSHSFSTAIRTLLIHQAIVDSFVCIMGIGLILQPFLWMSGNHHFDLFLCQAWHGQAIFWGGVFLSVWNLVFIAIERFLLVVFPLRHQKLHCKHLYCVFLVMYLMSVIMLGPAYFQVRYDVNDGQCHNNEYFFQGQLMKTIMHGYAIFWFLIIYAIPVILFFILYGHLLLSLHKRQTCSTLGSSRIINNANQQLTRTAITVTFIFIISLSWDSWFYLLGFAGVVSYEVNSTMQIIGVFLTVFNSCANPAIYSASMPIFRKSLKNIARCRFTPASPSQLASYQSNKSNDKPDKETSGTCMYSIHL